MNMMDRANDTRDEALFEQLERAPELLEELQRQVDPSFAKSLRSELRGRQARATENLFWFDVELPIGTIRVVHDEELVHLVDNDPRRYEFRAKYELGFEPRHAESKRVRSAAELVLAGRKRGNEIAFLGELTPFQQSVLKATSRIPRGGIRPYNWVAREAGNAGAVRATGTTLGHNPVPFIVPCHRVVRSDYSLGKYSAGGPEVKESVLRMEGLMPHQLEWIQHAPKFVGQLDSMEFCLPACGGLDESDPKILRGFSRAEDATRDGFVPCDVCRPV
jgi:O-6-methylguanine DNA methyltransferase